MLAGEAAQPQKRIYGDITERIEILVNGIMLTTTSLIFLEEFHKI